MGNAQTRQLNASGESQADNTGSSASAQYYRNLVHAAAALKTSAIGSEEDIAAGDRTAARSRLNHANGGRKLPRSIARQEAYISINLAKKDLADVPDDVFTIQNVCVLDLSENNIRHLPDRMRKLRKLRRLAIGSNRLERIPDAIGDLRSLAWLDFTHNGIQEISDRLGDLPELSSLGASDCRLRTVPLAICRLPKLRKLGLFNNLITSIPPEIGSLRGLTKLDLSGNALTRLPPEIGLLTDLQWLNLSNNQLEELPEELGNLTKLTELGLAYNRLRRLPDLSRLGRLTLLPVYNNQLEELGDWVGRLPSLSKLDLSSNNLVRIPLSVLTSPALTFLNLRRNCLIELPDINAAARLTTVKATAHRLELIDLRDNQLVSLPWSLLGPALVELKCAGNPLLRHGLLVRSSLVVPSLGEFCARAIVNGKISPPPPTSLSISQCMLLANRGGRCEGCGGAYEGYSHLPVHTIEFRQAADSAMVPFVARFCSPRCRRLFEIQIYESARMGVQH